MIFVINERTDDGKAFSGPLSPLVADLTGKENEAAFKQRTEMYDGLKAFALEMGAKLGVDEVEVVAIEFTWKRYKADLPQW